MDVAVSGTEKLSFEWFESGIPTWIDAKLDALYQCVYSSMGYLRAVNPDFRPSAFVVSRDGEVVDILIFTRAGNQLDVHCGVCNVQARSAALFARQALARYPDLHVVAFAPMRTPLADIQAQGIPTPYQAAEVLEDVVLVLPATADAYLRSLGSSTRSAIKRRITQLRKEYPSFAFEFQTKEAIDPARLTEVIQYHRLRMHEKGKISGVDVEYEAKIMKLVPRYGLVGLATINGEFAAGQVVYVVGSHGYFDMTAHDSKYSHVSIGRVAIYNLICECIARGMTEFHFLFGAYDYKYRLGGHDRQLVSLAIYRSRLHVVRNLRFYSRQTAKATLRTIRQRIDEVAWMKRGFGAARRGLNAARQARDRVVFRKQHI